MISKLGSNKEFPVDSQVRIYIMGKYHFILKFYACELENFQMQICDTSQGHKKIIDHNNLVCLDFLLSCTVLPSHLYTK